MVSQLLRQESCSMLQGFPTVRTYRKLNTYSVDRIYSKNEFFTCANCLSRNSLTVWSNILLDMMEDPVVRFIKTEIYQHVRCQDVK